jgi:hypothetical protein
MMFTSSILGRTNRCLRLGKTVPIGKGTETVLRAAMARCPTEQHQDRLCEPASAASLIL